MSTMGSYCKAYPLEQLRQFSGWAVNAQHTQAQTEAPDGEDEQSAPSDGNYLFIQEDYVVTDGIYKDENIVFDAVDENWIQFCREELNFQVPAYAKST